MDPREHKEFWDNVIALLRMQLDDQVALASGEALEAENGAVKGPAADLVEQALQGSLEDLQELRDEVQREVNDSSCKDPEYWRAISHKCAAARPSVSGWPRLMCPQPCGRTNLASTRRICRAHVLLLRSSAVALTHAGPRRGARVAVLARRGLGSV